MLDISCKDSINNCNASNICVSILFEGTYIKIKYNFKKDLIIG